MAFRNGSNYDYHFVIKELVEVEKKKDLFRRKHWKIITFSVPIKKKVTRTDKNRVEITKTISYILQFIDRTRFMASSLSTLINKIKCKI